MVDTSTWNAFQKELINRGIDKQTAFMLSSLYEKLMDMSETLDACAEAVKMMARNQEAFIKLTEADRAAINRLQKTVSGVTVESEAIADDPTEH